MLKKLKEYLQRRKDQRQWENQERRQAQHLLQAYKSTALSISKLTKEEKIALISLVNTDGFKAMLKVMDNLKAQGVNQTFFGPRDDELTLVRKGGVQIMTAFQSKIKDLVGVTPEQNEQIMRDALGGLLW